jgi:hypothetical protein
MATQIKKEAQATIVKKALSPFMGKLLTGLGTGSALGVGWDQATYGDSGLSGSRAMNFAKNFGMGMAAPYLWNKSPSLAVLDVTAGPPLTNAAAESIKTQIAYQKANKNIFEKFNDLTPTQKTLTVAATGLTAALAVPALMNLSAAAKRLADGRAVRLSTSIRKRRNQDKDLVIGVQPIAGEGEEIQSEQIAKPEESKGFLSKIFG